MMKYIHEKNNETSNKLEKEKEKEKDWAKGGSEDYYSYACQRPFYLIEIIDIIWEVSSGKERLGWLWMKFSFSPPCESQQKQGAQDAIRLPFERVKQCTCRRLEG